MNKFKKLLSRMTLKRVRKILGHDADKLLREGGIYQIDIEEHVELTENSFKVNTHDFCVELIYNEASNRKLEIKSSSTVESPEVGAVFSLILEEKLAEGFVERSNGGRLNLSC